MPYVGKSMDRRRNARRRQLNGAHTALSWNAEYAVGEERCAPGCIDAEIEEEQRHAVESGNYGEAGDRCGYGNECGRLGCPECQE